MVLNEEIIFTDFCEELGISDHQRDRRKKELLLWLKDFFEYTYIKSIPNKIIINKVLADYRQMPRKKYDASARLELAKEKQKDYTEYTKKALPRVYKPTSKSKIARDAMQSFGTRKYGHQNQEWVTKTFISEPFDKNAITNDRDVWVWYKTYQPLDADALATWRNILSEEKISEKEAARAFYRKQRGEDISKEESYYQKALERIRIEYGQIPILVKEWKIRQ